MTERECCHTLLLWGCYISIPQLAFEQEKHLRPWKHPAVNASDWINIISVVLESHVIEVTRCEVWWRRSGVFNQLTSPYGLNQRSQPPNDYWNHFLSILRSHGRALQHRLLIYRLVCDSKNTHKSTVKRKSMEYSLKLLNSWIKEPVCVLQLHWRDLGHCSSISSKFIR